MIRNKHLRRALAAALAMAVFSGAPALSDEDIGEALGKAILEGLMEGLAEDEDSPASSGRSGYGLPNAPSDWRPGSRVLGQWSNGKWYPAQVDTVRRDGYRLVFDDGDTAVVDASRIHPFVWRVGSRVECKWQGNNKYYFGRIAAMKGNHLFIKYDDGDKENTTTSRCRDAGNIGRTRTTRKKTRPAKVVTAPAPTNRRSGTGTRVLGQWSDGKWYPARVQSQSNGRYRLQFDDGDVATVGGHQVTPLSWSSGTRVDCRYQGGRSYYSGVISRIAGNTLTVVYNGGNRETTAVGFSGRGGSASAYSEQRRRLQESSADVPSDPTEFLRVIEQNRGR